MAATIDLPKVPSGDTFTSKIYRIYTDEAKTSRLDLTGAVITMQLKVSASGSPVHTFKYTVPTPTNGEIILSAWDVNLPPRTYYYDLRIQTSKKLTYIQGKMQVTETYSEWPQ